MSMVNVSHLAAGDDMAAGTELLKAGLRSVVPDNDISCNTEIITYQYEDARHIIFWELKLKQFEKINNSQIPVLSTI